ncbi:MAG: MBL fold metallo-hydrolase [Candidatus Omnitrophica bacterium]|nr:MBL fold metallo-hydrolase [Candidatus Omnitrophota bacterium]
MSSIIINILGTTAGVPTEQRAHSATTLTYLGGSRSDLLFDCGEGTQRQMLRAGFNMMKLGAVFLTHWHGDHCLGVPGLLDTLGFEGRTDPLYVCAPEARRIKRCLSFSHSMAEFPVKQVAVSTSSPRPAVVMDREDHMVVSVPVEHSVPAVAYAFIEKDRLNIDPGKSAEFGLPPEGRVYSELKEKGEVVSDGAKISLERISTLKKGRRIVYSGDTRVCSALEDLVEGADLLIQDCTYFHEQSEYRPHAHACLPEILEMVKTRGVKRTLLTHISRKHRDMAELEDIVGEYPDIQVARDLMRVEL